MSLRVEYAAWFDADLHFRTAWYLERGGSELAERFAMAVEATVNRLKGNPQRGRRPYPNDSDLTAIHAVLLQRPFNKHILYYRLDEETLFLERLIHGARDLPRRLRESPFEPE